MEPPFDAAARSILIGDRNKQKSNFDLVESVSVNDETGIIEIRLRGGEERHGMIAEFQQLIFHAGSKRAMAPADVHDAVYATMMKAVPAMGGR